MRTVCFGADPFDVERVFGDLMRDQYQGGPTVLTAISGAEIACWDLIGKACGQPVYRLLGGRSRDRLPAYANGWYGGARTPDDYAARAREVIGRGYRAMKFDPFGTAWKEMTREQMDEAEGVVAAVRQAVGDGAALMIEVHGRLSVGCAIEMGRRLAPYRPAWYEEPVTPTSLELLREVKQALPFPVAAGERLYTLEDFQRLTAMRLRRGAAGPDALRRLVGWQEGGRPGPGAGRAVGAALLGRAGAVSARCTSVGPRRRSWPRKTLPTMTCRGATNCWAVGIPCAGASSCCRKDRGWAST